MAVVSPKRTVSPWPMSAIADLRRTGRELVRCGTKLPFAVVVPMTTPSPERTWLHRPSRLHRSEQTGGELLFAVTCAKVGWVGLSGDFLKTQKSY